MLLLLTFISSLNHVPCSLAKAIMIFHPCRSLIAYSASVTRPSLSPFISSTIIFSLCFALLHLLLIIPAVTRCSSFSLITWPKKVCSLHILSTSDIFGSASHNTISFAVLDILNILHKNHISVASSFFCSCSETFMLYIQISG